MHTNREQLTIIERHRLGIEQYKMKTLKYSIHREGKYYVSRCLTIEVASFGKTVDEALANLKEAIALYLEKDFN